MTMSIRIVAEPDRFGGFIVHVFTQENDQAEKVLTSVTLGTWNADSYAKICELVGITVYGAILKHPYAEERKGL